MEENTQTFISYEVVQGPIATPEGVELQTGDILERVAGDDFAQGMLDAGIIKVFGSTDPAEQAVPEPLAAPVETNTNKEPRKRYRGHIVEVDGMRTVGEQTFHHIRCEDGAEYDLTDLEYHEVVVSYPPQQ